ncbi:hypothetical protein [endosymbiont GvMRE of Glomus versiforme]|uniref:hypothetical protein n=1 Tax=endosymbiont GvMRE of Glomus versiforme TaxID=2039283 RepID=UPI000EB92537|nr:hypothetical protein [endosymbiont GvMRE of Glomus versiforme]RHZ35575.1 Serine/threonine protein kinase [endosymbiont GvMRE of Glomus versiforme]
MVNAQNWINDDIPFSQRNSIRELYIWPVSIQQTNPRYISHSQDSPNRYFFPDNNKLEGVLDLSTFPNLEQITVESQLITGLILVNCQNIRRVCANDNLLEEVIWPIPNSNQVIPLENIQLTNNNFFGCDLFEFSNFIHLKTLLLGTDERAKIDQGIFNRWTGSLIHLRNMVGLLELDINCTDINSGLEYLPVDGGLYRFTFGKIGREEARVERLQNILLRDIPNEIVFEGSRTIDDWAFKGTYATENYFRSGWSKAIDIRIWQNQFQAQIQSN